MKKSIIIAVVFALVGLGIGYFAFSSENVLTTVSTANDATFKTARIAEVGLSPASDTSTSTSILNTDSTDRVVTNAWYYCNVLGTSKTYLTGTGLANLIFRISTSSNSTGYGVTNANYLLDSNVATTSAGTSVYTSSSTTPFPDNTSRLWASGSYIRFYSNATNTAQCVIGVDYLAS